MPAEGHRPPRGGPAVLTGEAAGLGWTRLHASRRRRGGISKLAEGWRAHVGLKRVGLKRVASSLFYATW